MSLDLPEPDYGDGQDAYARFRQHEHLEHLLTQENRRHEALTEHRPARPDPKPAKREKRGATPPLVAWKLTVLERDQGCQVHTNPADCSDGWQAHHVVPQQILRRAVVTEALWDPRSGMGVCGLAHRQHHTRVRPILFTEIPTVCVEYLSGLGFGAWLERHYP